MITHPEKVMFPEDGITKGELCAYYEQISPQMLPHIRGRPVTMERYPAGIGKPGFIQKDVSKGFPEWLERVEVPKKGGSSHHPLVAEARALLWVANQNCVTPHVWTSRVPNLYKPDLCVFDLDPSRDEPEAIRAATLAVRDVLAGFGLQSWVKTSGSKGFHIVVPLDRETGFDDVSQFAHGVGAVLVKRHPDTFTQEFIKADREGRILVDTGRNFPGATFAAVYAIRPKPGAPVSAPCSWQEVEQGLVGPQTFQLRTMAERIHEVGDVWADLHEHGQSLKRSIEELGQLLTEDDWRESRAASTRRPGTRKARRQGPMR